MSRIKTILIQLITSASLVCALLLPIETQGANARALDLMQQGYTECKNAHLLRRKDLEQAKSAYAVYLDLKDQAAVLDKRIFEKKDEDVDRIVSYCDTVGADILRTEALPVFTLGVAACGEAAEYLRNSELSHAKKSYSQYLKYKEEAVQITDAILEVFSVRTDMRRCDRVSQDIEVESSRQNEIASAIQESVEYIQKTLDSCQALLGLESQLSSADEVGLAETRIKWQSLQKRMTQIPNQELFTVGEITNDSEQFNEIAKLRQDTDACQVSLQKAVDAREQELIALAAEALKQQQALEAAQEAEQRAVAIQEETEEQRNARLSNNYEYYTLVKRVAPEFPKRALRGGFKGYVVIEYRINPEGVVTNPVVIESQPNDIFDKAALTAIKQWQYEANFKDIEPADALARTRMLFSYAD